MIYIFFFLWSFVHIPDGLATDPFALAEATTQAAIPKSKEIKKVTKLLEDPEERHKLVKTLKVLAAAQEAKEKKSNSAFATYIDPIIRFCKESVATFATSLKKISIAILAFINSLKVEEAIGDFWASLFFWLPILILMAMAMEYASIWLLRRAFEVKQPTEKNQRLAKSKINYILAKLFIPFLYPLLCVPYVVSNVPAQRWLGSLFVLLFMIRFLSVQKQEIPSFALGVKINHSFFVNVLRGIISFFISIPLFAAAVACFPNEFAIQEFGAYAYWLKGQDFLLTSALLLFFPFSLLWFQEWRTHSMPQYLEESRTLSTTPKKLGFLTNIFIRYMPLFLLIFSTLSIIDGIFLEGDFFNIYGIKCIITFLFLSYFLHFRRFLDALAHYKIPKFQSSKVQAFASYVVSLQFTLIQSLQWVLCVAFFSMFILIWDESPVDSLINFVSHPTTKVMITIGGIWGLFYLTLLGLNSFVQFHIKPQMIKGKRREPTAFAKTFGPMLHSVARWVITLLAVFITLETLGFNLKVLVYLMSAFAFAISLGAQSLVKDIINGFFALVDGSFAIGETITVAGNTGVVESLSLRAITLRHSTGFLQTIPFSEVTNIINRSRNYNFVSIDVATSYKTKIGDVYKALTETVEEMKEDAIFGKMILEPLSISGIDRFSESAMHVSASIKIVPDPKNTFGRELNRRLKNHMDALNIAPPVTFQETWTSNLLGEEMKP